VLTYGRWSSPMCSDPPSSEVNILAVGGHPAHDPGTVIVETIRRRR
jgi:hypothetical protein